MIDAGIHVIKCEIAFANPAIYASIPSTNTFLVIFLV